MSIIPQDPTLFSGTIKSNLDPFEEYSEADLWDVLNKVKLQGFVQSQTNQLKYEVHEGGQNLSVGQRQLMCMARALLRKAKVHCLRNKSSARACVCSHVLYTRSICIRFFITYYACHDACVCSHVLHTRCILHEIFHHILRMP
jgi:ABC-type transport system involved in Fe-S cluster assembly fused permease/ATPase subunit